MERKIKDIYNISFNIEDVSNEDMCPMHDWYNNLINKTINQLDLFDVTRMIIQKILLDLAVSKSIGFIEKNPFCGQRYEGELLELLFKLDMTYLNDYKDILSKIISQAFVENKSYDWLCEDERVEFSDLLKSFKMKIQEE